MPLVWAALLVIQVVAGDGAWALVRTPSWVTTGKLVR